MDAPLPPEVVHAIITGYSHLLANKYHVLASTVMLVYDHILTFERERVYIWKKKKNLPTYLFFIFRYITPLVSIINLFALHDPRWVGKICDDWIWLPVACGPIISAATGIILILRVYAIYHKSKWVLFITVPIYLAELGVMGWSIPAGAPAPLPPGFVGCVPSEKAGTGRRLSALYIAALVFDATIFLLTFGRAVYLRFTSSAIPIVTLVVRDGTFYFTIIFVVNVANVITLSVVTPDLSAINAPFASMITTILVARLVLNLREAGSRDLHYSQRSEAPSGSPAHPPRTMSTWHPATVPAATQDSGTTGTTMSSSEAETRIMEVEFARGTQAAIVASGVEPVPEVESKGNTNNKMMAGIGAITSFFGVEEFDVDIVDVEHELGGQETPWIAGQGATNDEEGRLGPSIQMEDLRAV